MSSVERTGGAVLIVSTSIDLATDRVVDILAERNVRALRLNTEDLSYSQSITWMPQVTGESGSRISLGGDLLTLDDVQSVWYRRCRKPPCPEGCDPGVHQYVVNETYAALRGILSSLPASIRWMSPPNRIDVAELKTYQLNIAQEIGFRVPQTLVSSDPAMIRGFYAEWEGDVVAKPIRSGYLEAEGKGYAIYTRVLDVSDLESLDNAVPCPIVVQRRIEKTFDIRVTVVGTQIFSAAIDAQGDEKGRTDWRRSESSDLPHYRHELPVECARRILKLAEVMGLSFAAVDLVLDRDGKYWFLEVNPSGQWLWLDDRLDLGISGCVATWLQCR